MALNERTTRREPTKEPERERLRDAYLVSINSALEAGREDRAHELAAEYLVELRAIPPVRI